MPGGQCWAVSVETNRCRHAFRCAVASRSPIASQRHRGAIVASVAESVTWLLDLVRSLITPLPPTSDIHKPSRKAITQKVDARAGPLKRVVQRRVALRLTRATQYSCLAAVPVASRRVSATRCAHAWAGIKLYAVVTTWSKRQRGLFHRRYQYRRPHASRPNSTRWSHSEGTLGIRRQAVGDDDSASRRSAHLRCRPPACVRATASPVPTPPRCGFRRPS